MLENWFRGESTGKTSKTPLDLIQFVPRTNRIWVGYIACSVRENGKEIDALANRNLTRELLAEEVGVVLPPPAAPEETLVPDARAGLTPSQLVDRRLASWLAVRPPTASPMG